MVLYPTKRCCTAKCSLIGTYMSATSKEVRFCEEHKPADAINLVATTCNKCGLTDVVNNDGVCSDCDPEAMKKYARAKELAVKSWLDANGFKYISYDRTIEQGACLLVRPDFIFDAGTHFIIIEVDENQHYNYPCECEQTRMINIAQALGMSCIFIRYNPDGYKDAAGKRCNPSHLTRMKLLRKWLDLCLDPAQSPEASGSFVNAAYLYYDGHSDTDTQMQTLQHLDGASTSGRQVPA
jgi:hypothetical protein